MTKANTCIVHQEKHLINTTENVDGENLGEGILSLALYNMRLEGKVYSMRKAASDSGKRRDTPVANLAMMRLKLRSKKIIWWMMIIEGKDIEVETGCTRGRSPEIMRGARGTSLTP